MRVPQLTSLLLLAVGLGQSVSAELEARIPLAAGPVYANVHAAECKIVNAAVNSLKLVPSATHFCSSFLHIKTKTSTVTATKVVPTTSTTFVATSTVTIRKTVTAIARSTLTSFTSTKVVTWIVTGTSTGNETVTVSKCRGTLLPVATTTNAVNRRAVPIPAPVRSYASAQLSTACLCLGIPTPSTTATTTRTVVSTSVASATSTAVRQASVTVDVTSILTTKIVSTTTSTSTAYTVITPTATVERCPVPTTTCGNQDLQYGIYLDADRTVLGNNFQPEAFKTRSPDCMNSTSSLGPLIYWPGGFSFVQGYQGCDYIFAPDPGYFYFASHTIATRGYLYAEQTGVYTFGSVRAASAVQMWLGDLAYSGWNGSNANLTQAGEQGYASFEAHLVAGSYYAIRTHYTHVGGGDAYFFIQISDPTGNQIQPYYVTQSCDGTTAPAYQAFGQQT